MKRSLSVFAVFILGICVVTGAVNAQMPSPSITNRKEANMIKHATGAFDVKLNPLPTYDQDDKSFGRMSIDKQFHGDLQADSRGEMLAYVRLAYVAIEKVTGTLKGRTGSFILQHTATLINGKPTLTINVVPTSATGQLTGLEGRMNVTIAPDGKHSYEFEYTLPEAQ